MRAHAKALARRSVCREILTPRPAFTNQFLWLTKQNRRKRKSPRPRSLKRLPRPLPLLLLLGQKAPVQRPRLLLPRALKAPRPPKPPRAKLWPVVLLPPP